jgi:thioredoxin reductase (NADPH)
MLDLIIIGAGPSGLTAAIYAIRAGLKVLVLEAEMYGGQIGIAPEVENYPSIQKISGWQLAQNIYDQAINQGADIRFEQVTGVDLTGAIKKVITSEGSYEAKTVIIANGAKRRKLKCPGEEEFTGRGVSYCATCDGAFFKGKTVAVVGGGNTALEDALFLSNLCAKVYIIIRSEIKGEKHLAAAVRGRANIEILKEYRVKSISGEALVTGFDIESLKTGEAKHLEVSAVFIAIGLEPDNRLFKDQLTLDAYGYIISDETCTTGIKGVFAAGDTRTKELRQIITAASDGAVAAVSAANLINTEEGEKQ